jgi:hypothetical protein
MTKTNDDYQAKLKLWAADPKVVALPQPINVPRFGSRKFSSYAEMNAWKAESAQQMARQGGLRWKSVEVAPATTISKVKDGA